MGVVVGRSGRGPIEPPVSVRCSAARFFNGAEPASVGVGLPTQPHDRCRIGAALFLYGVNTVSVGVELFLEPMAGSGSDQVPSLDPK